MSIATLINPYLTYIKIAAVAVLLAAFGLYTLHERSVGEQKIEKADATVVAKAEVHNTQVEATQSADDKKAGAKLDASLSDPIGALPSLPPSMPVQACPSAVPAPRSHPSPSAPATVLRTEPTPSVVQPDWKDIERSDVQSGHNADAEVTYLHSLLEAQYKLCAGKP
jgi:hypothetical protein